MSWTVQSITDLSTGYWQSCVLSAAIELNLFEAIGKGGTAVEIASRSGSAPRHTDELLNALAGMHILEKQGEVFRLSPSAAQFLRESAPMSMLDALRFNIDLYQLWGRLGTCIHDGKPVLPPSAHLGDDAGRTRRFVMGMHSRALAMAPALLSAVDDLNGRTKLLDLGSGPGTFSRIMAEKHSKLHVTLFDLPPVLAIARELTEASPLVSRFAYAPGDYRKDAYPGGFDAVLYSGALHQETPESARIVFKKIYDALVPGGMVMVVDMMLETDRTQPLFSVLFSLNMMLINPGARVFTGNEVLDGLRSVGFGSEQCVKPEGCPYWVVKAVR